MIQYSKEYSHAWMKAEKEKSIPAIEDGKCQRGLNGLYIGRGEGVGCSLKL